MGGQASGRQLRFFVYVSEARLKDLLDQIGDRARRNILERLQPTFGFNIAPFSLSVQPKFADRSASDRSRAVRVAMVEEIIREEFQIGDLASGAIWITGRVDMEWAPVGGDTVLFCGYAGPLLVVLQGSAGHLIGQVPSGTRTGSYSHALKAAILDGDSPENLGDGLAAAAKTIVNSTSQPMRFLAQVTRRGQLTGGRQREFVLARPLYIEESPREDPSPDSSLQGTVGWVSADRSWCLIDPDGEREDAVVYDSGSASPDSGRAFLTVGQRVEFRVTHGTAGILATSVRVADVPVDAEPGTAATRGQPLGAGDPGHLGGYEVLRRLGEGSMGVVYLARGDDGLAAIKMIRSELARAPEFLRRFQAEADNASRVSGPNLARVIAAITDSEQPYLVTEFVDGPTLEERVGQHGPLSARSALETSAGIAAALDVIHQAGIVHRDLTPANVILSSAGPKVIDFGIAHALDSETRLTQAGWPIGTPAYMSPEQVSEGPLTPASDIFSWAGLTVFAATGRQPFARKDSPRSEIWQAIRADDPDLSGVPSRLRKILSAALNKDPARRPLAAEVRDAMHSYLEETELPSRRTASRWPRLAFAAALVAVAAVITAVFVKIDLSHGGNSLACPASTQSGIQQVATPSSSATANAELVICPVQVDHGKAPGRSSSLSGTIRGKIPSSQILMVVSQPDRNSCATDGTLGTGGYYYVGSVVPDSRGEWSVTSGDYYPGAQSIQRHFYFLLGSPSAVSSFKETQDASGGAPSLPTPGAFQLLGSFTFTPVQPANRYCSG